MKTDSSAFLNELFCSYFDAPLTAKGFRRKGTLYYRIHGNVLQGVTLVRSKNDYMIRYNMFPYWVYGSDVFHGMLSFERELKILKSGTWAEGQLKDFPGVPFSLPVQSEALEKIKDNLKRTCQEITYCVLPEFDRVFDEFTYFAHISNNPQKWYILEQKVILKIASMQNDFGLAKVYLERQKSLAICSCYGGAIQKYVYECLPLTGSAHLNPTESLPEEKCSRKDPKQLLFTMPTQKIAHDYQHLKKQRFALLEEKIQTNDLHWINKVYEEDCLRVGKLLKEALNIEVD